MGRDKDADRRLSKFSSGTKTAIELVNEIKRANQRCQGFGPDSKRKQSFSSKVNRVLHKVGGRGLYAWRHPICRMFAPIYIMLSDILVHAADPVDHTEIEYRMAGVGHAYNMMNMWNDQKLPPLGHALKLILLFCCLGMGIVLPRIWRERGYEKHRVMTWLMTGPVGLALPLLLAIFFMAIAAFIWNTFLDMVLGIPPCCVNDFQQATTPYFTDGMGVSWRTSANAIDSMVFVIDWLTLYLVIDIILQDNTQYAQETKFHFRGIQYDARQLWTQTWNGKLRIILTWVLFCVSTVAGTYFVWETSRWIQIKREGEFFEGQPTGPIQWWKYLVDFNQYQRAQIYTTQFFADIVIVLQDWEFPTFENQVRVAFLGTNIAFEGRIGNYAMMFVVAAIDLKALYYALSYYPEWLAQYTDVNNWVWAFNNQTLIRTEDPADWENVTSLQQRQDLGCFRKLKENEIRDLAEDCVDLKKWITWRDQTEQPVESVQDTESAGISDMFMCGGINACCDVRIRARYDQQRAKEVTWLYVISLCIPVPATLFLTYMLTNLISRSRSELCRRTVLSMTLARQFELKKVKRPRGAGGLGLQVDTEFFNVRWKAIANLFDHDPRGQRRSGSKTITSLNSQTFLGDGDDQTYDDSMVDAESEMSVAEEGEQYKMTLTKPRRGAPLLLVTSQGVFSIHAGLNAVVKDVLEYMDTHGLHKGVNKFNVRLRSAHNPFRQLDPEQMLGSLLPTWGTGTAVVPLYVHSKLKLEQEARGDAESLYSLCSAVVLGIQAAVVRLCDCFRVLFGCRANCADRRDEFWHALPEAFKLFMTGGKGDLPTRDSQESLDSEMPHDGSRFSGAVIAMTSKGSGSKVRDKLLPLARKASHTEEIMKFDVTLQNWFDHGCDMQAAYKDMKTQAVRREGLLNARAVSAVAWSAKGYDLYPSFLAGDTTVREEDFPICYTMTMRTMLMKDVRSAERSRAQSSPTPASTSWHMGDKGAASQAATESRPISRSPRGQGVASQAATESRPGSRSPRISPRPASRQSSTPVLEDEGRFLASMSLTLKGQSTTRSKGRRSSFSTQVTAAKTLAPSNSFENDRL